MPIGTAAPTESERRRVRHHEIEVLDPTRPDSVAEFLERARKVLDTPGPDLLAVGGTGQYLSGLKDGLEPSPGTDPELRKLLQERFQREGREVLHAELARMTTPPPDAWANPVRLVRALEKALLRERGEVGKGYPALAADAPVLFLQRGREDLHRRLAARLESMLAQGWPEEVRRLREGGVPFDAPGLQAIGFRELWDVPSTAEVPAQVREEILARTRAYARRQETWARNRLRAVMVPCGEDRPIAIEVLDGFLASSARLGDAV